MRGTRLYGLGLVVALAFPAVPGIVAAKTKVKTEKIKTQLLEYPEVPIEGIDYGALQAEFALGTVTFGAERQATVKHICMPAGSKNIKDAVEVAVHYYEVPYTVPEAVLVLKNGTGEVVYGIRLSEPAKASAKFGFKDCKHARPQGLKSSWGKGQRKFKKGIMNEIRGEAWGEAKRIVENALFFNYAPEVFKLGRAIDKKKAHDYADTDQAFNLAKGAYGRYAKQGFNQQSHDNLVKAIGLWEKALTESDTDNKKARINKKVTIMLHDNIGMAAMFVNEYQKTMIHLGKRSRLSSITTSSSSGTGSADIMARARRRKLGYNYNKQFTSPDAIAKMMSSSDRYRGKIKIAELPPDALAALSQQARTWMAKASLEYMKNEQEEIEDAHASGKINKYESLVQRNALQGNFLYVNPYMTKKLTDIPVAICDLDQLNQLRLDSHEIAQVPPEIGKLKKLELLSLNGNRLTALPPEIGQLSKLKTLNLSKNQLTSLPDEIGKLSSLKKLNLKKNKFSKAEQARIQKMLPNTKIKF